VTQDRGRALVVDDDPNVRTLLSDFMEALGYSVWSGSDGAAALGRLRHGGCEVLVTDFMMPGLNGLEVAESARSHDRQLAIVMVTGSALEIDTERLAELRVVLLAKPFDLRQLEMAVEKAREIRASLPDSTEQKGVPSAAQGPAKSVADSGMSEQWLDRLRALADEAKTSSETLGRLVALAEETVREHEELQTRFSSLEQHHRVLSQAHDALTLAHGINAATLAEVQREYQAAVGELRNARQQSQALVQERGVVLEDLLRVLQRLRQDIRPDKAVSK